MKVTATLGGIDGFKTATASRVEIMREALRAGIGRGAHIVAQAARDNALNLRDAHRKGPSALADSISVSESGEGAEVVAAAPYATFVEFGTRRAAAQPFLGPAFAAHKADIELSCKTAVEAIAKERA